MKIEIELLDIEASSDTNEKMSAVLDYAMIIFNSKKGKVTTKTYPFWEAVKSRCKK